MRTCRACGRENPDERDFCECGEYLRWEPTGYMPAVSQDAARVAASTPAAPPDQQESDPNLTLAADAASSASSASTASSAASASAAARPWGTPAAAGGLAAGARPQPGTPGSGDAPPGAAALLLRLPDDDSASPGIVSVSVEPGQEVNILGLIRNQSEVVDNFELWIRGLPEDWWTITPSTAYLVPYGTGGVYEQEFQVHIHPPRRPEAQARSWSFEVVADSRAYDGEVASAPASATIGPYFDVSTEVRPERASGRLKARYRLVVRNRANARTEVMLSAEDTDAECRFRFAEPKIALEPGNAMECTFSVFPPKQIWFGKPLDRHFSVKAAPLGVELEQPPRAAVFRQRAWLPRWVPVAVALVAGLVILALKLMPKQEVVPNVVGQPSVFAAQKLLNKVGLVLAPKAASKPDASKPAGSIADQSPPAGTKAKKGAVVNVEVYTGTGKVVIPSVVDLTPGQADQALIASSLALGTVSPQPLNPAGKIYAQLPPAGTPVADGTAVAVFLALPKSAAASPTGTGTTAKTTTGAASSTGRNGSTSSGSSASGGSSGGAGPAAAAAAVLPAAAVAAEAGKGPITIPALSSDPTTAAATLSQLGLLPFPVKQLATVPVNQVAGTLPGAGSKVAKGAQVDLLISSGSPQLAYDDGQTIHVIDPTTLQASGTVSPGSGGPQVEPSWNPSGSELVYSQNGQLVLDQPDVKKAVPFQMTAEQSGVSDVNPSFAPTTTSQIVAFIQRSPSGAQLCFAAIGRFALNASCTNAPGWDLGGQVDWSPDGSTILVLGTENNGSTFGLLAFTSNVPFSTQASNWGHGTLETNDAVSGQGVFAGAFSPSGKQMALASNVGSDDFHLYIVPAGDFNPTPAQELPVRACQVAWRSDSLELAVMDPDGACGPDATGTIFAINPLSPRLQTVLATGAAHPAWQPVPGGG